MKNPHPEAPGEAGPRRAGGCGTRCYEARLRRTPQHEGIILFDNYNLPGNHAFNVFCVGQNKALPKLYL